MSSRPIAEISENFRLTTRWKRPRTVVNIAFLGSVFASVVCLFIGAGPRHSFQNNWFSTTLFTIGPWVWIGGIWLYLDRVSVPGCRPSAASILLILIGGVLTGLTPLIFSWSPSFTFGLNPAGAACSMECILLALTPMIFLTASMRFLAPVQPKVVAFHVAMSAMLFGYATLWHLCPDEHPLHLLVYHFAPVATLPFVVTLVLSRLVRW